MRKTTVNGFECEVNGQISKEELHGVAQELIGEDYKSSGTLGLATTVPRVVYVAANALGRAGTLLHEALHQVIFTNDKLKKSLRRYNTNEEWIVEALEEGLVEFYAGLGCELPDPYYLDSAAVKTDGRYL